MELIKAGPTMSSREIADLIEKQHNHIKVSADRLAARGVIGTPAVREFAHNGNSYTEYLFNKRDSLILVAQNSPEFTARIVDRWQELEAAQAPKLPQTFAQALRLAAEQAETIEAQQLRIEAQKPAVEFVGRYVEATGLKGFRQVAKLLNVKEPAFREFLTRHKIMYHLGGEWVAYSQHIEAGRFVMKAGVSEGTGHAFNASKFTPKGVEWIAGLMASENAANAMKASA
jgi:phage antirepressor YoqD-like protein